MGNCSWVGIRRAGSPQWHGAMAAMGGAAAGAVVTKLEESVIDFGSVVSGKTVRAVKIDGVYWMPRRDIIMAVCNQDNVKASKTWTQKLSQEDRDDLLPFLAKHQFDGIGQSETECYNMDGAILLTMILPGKFARGIRMKAAGLLKKWIHDHTNDPLMREMTAEPQGVLGKRSREDLEMGREERQLAILERKAALLLAPVTLDAEIARVEQLRAHVEQLRLENHNTMVQGVQTMCPGNVLDDRDRFLFKDRMMNIAHRGGPSAGMITDGEECPRSVSDIVTDMKKVIDKKGVQQIGRVAAAKYRKRHGEDAKILKQSQFIGGRITPVNCFAAMDHDLVWEAVEEYLAAPLLPVSSSP
jgi:hypothetical protein